MKTTIKLLLIASMPLVVAAKSSPPQCMAGLKQALIDGGFSGGILCSSKSASFRLVGRTTGGKYSIYDYRYQFLPHSGGVMHGGQRLVVFKGGKYLGQYGLPRPPLVDVFVKGTQVILRTSDGPPFTVTADFSGEPPRSILIGGEVEHFFR